MTAKGTKSRKLERAGVADLRSKSLTVTDFGVALVLLVAKASAPIPELLEFQRLDSAEVLVLVVFDPRSLGLIRSRK
jgi:hypothetical protein